MIKKRVTKKVQHNRPTALGRIMKLLNITNSRTSADSNEHENDTTESDIIEPIDFPNKKRDKKSRKIQEEEITEQIPEENEQQQEQIGENQQYS